MTRLNILLLSIITLSLFSCLSKSTVKEVDFTSKFKQLNLDSTSKDTLGVYVDFCTAIGADWDSIYVIPPYANTDFIDSIKADNLRDIYFVLKGAQVTEWAVHLVLVNKRKIVSYGLLSAGALDLTRLVHPDGTYYILTKEHCSKFYATFKRPYPYTWSVHLIE